MTHKTNNILSRLERQNSKSEPQEDAFRLKNTEKEEDIAMFAKYIYLFFTASPSLSQHYILRNMLFNSSFHDTQTSCMS